MISLTKTDAREDLALSGRTFTLVSRTWAFSFQTSWFGLGANYRRPHRLEAEDEPSRQIHDHLMLARLGALALLILAMVARRVRND
jgi:hypothetical protein